MHHMVLGLLFTSLIISASCADVELPPDPPIRGYIWSSQPIVGAQIQIFQLDRKGYPVDERPAWYVPEFSLTPGHQPVVSGPDGSFEIETSEFPGTIFMIRAIGGTTREFWNDSPRILDPIQPHTHSIVTYHDPFADRPVILSPFTEMSFRLAQAWLAREQDLFFEDVIAETNDAFSKLAYVYSPEQLTSMTHTIPEEAHLPAITPGGGYFLALQQLSALAREWTMASGNEIRTQDIVDCALDDIQADAVIDGQSICDRWETESLRVFMMRALVRHYVNAHQPDLPYQPVEQLFQAFLDREDEFAFSDTQSLPIDELAPWIEIDQVSYQDGAVEIRFAVIDDVTGVFVSDDLAASGTQVYIDNPRPTLAPLSFDEYVPPTSLYSFGWHAFHTKLRLSDLGDDTVVTIIARDQAGHEAYSVDVGIDPALLDVDIREPDRLD